MYKNIQEIFKRAMRKDLTFYRAKDTVNTSKLKSWNNLEQSNS